MNDVKKIIIFGNSGSGKSTLAKKISERLGLKHLDLDTLAWKKTQTPERLAIKDSSIVIDKFLLENDQWVIEGCYSDLIDLITSKATQAIFMDISIEDCIQNARNRPWEPHKYQSKDEQEANLPMLIDWIKEYNQRNDTLSRNAHLKTFNEFQGLKVQIKSNSDSIEYIKKNLN